MAQSVVYSAESVNTVPSLSQRSIEKSRWFRAEVEKSREQKAKEHKAKEHKAKELAKAKAKDRELHGYKVSMNGEQMLKVGQKLLESRDFIFISLDLEMWELDCNFITEIGISVLDMTKQKQCWAPNIETWHLIPTEASKRFNGRRIAEKRNFFTQGKSMVTSLAHCREFWAGLVETLKKKSPNVFYIGQGVKEDLYCLSKNNFPLDRSLPVLDTNLIWEAHCSLPSSLGKMLEHVGIHHAFLHNAGNDAYYTLRLLIMILDQTVRDKYQLDVGPNRAEADRISREAAKKEAEKKKADKTSPGLDPDATQSKLDRLDAATRKKVIAQKKRERGKTRLQATRDDMPGKFAFVSGKELSELVSRLGLSQGPN